MFIWMRRGGNWQKCQLQCFEVVLSYAPSRRTRCLQCVRRAVKMLVYVNPRGGAAKWAVGYRVGGGALVGSGGSHPIDLAKAAAKLDCLAGGLLLGIASADRAWSSQLVS